MTAVVLLALASSAGAQIARFHVLRSDEVIGHVIASRQALPNGELYTMVSDCEVDLVWRQRIRTSLRTEYANGALAACHTSLRVNDAVRDSSCMVRGTEDCFVHPKAPFDCVRSTDWTTSRLYYAEPVGQSMVFVESVLRDCPLVRTGPGTYTLTFPNGHTNRYVYREGQLYEIQVSRPLMDLVFRRA
ncbi:MAG: hypothetical protein JNL05_09200 [Flavobacteriales bacterium]|nr:hypothetical protein [Flavobacteriales bacterium]